MRDLSQFDLSTFQTEHCIIWMRGLRTIPLC